MRTLRAALAIAAVCICAGTGFADSAPASMLSFQPVYQYFLWEEFFGDGQELEESGMMPGMALDYVKPITSNVTLYVQSQLYAGDVDYDGFVVNIFGQTRPYESETRYYGVQADADIGLDLTDADSFDFSPVVGLGFRYWLRELDRDGSTGYDEYWATLHARAGVRMKWSRASRDYNYAWVVAILPILNDETAKNVPLSREGSVSLEPKKRPGLQAEAGMVRQNMIVALFFEALNFDQSDPDSSGAFVQPKSEKKVGGIKIGFVF